MRKKTRRLRYLDKKYIWHPFTQMKDWIHDEPLIIERGEGCYLFDTDGNQYLDGVSSLWVNVHGHRKKELDDALQEQIKKIAHSTHLGLSHIPSIELAEELIRIAPKGLTKVFYSDSGSTAVEISLKMAYQYWQLKNVSSRKTFIAFDEAYHGDTLGAVSVGGIDLFHKKFKPLLFHVKRFASPYLYAGTREMAKLLCDIESDIEKHPNQYIGIVIEPMIQAAAGMRIHPKGFLREIRKICDRQGLLLILDEVATGFGRTGKMFACDHEKVRPDIMAVAKGISGGYLPIAATLVKEKIYRAFLGEYHELKTFFHGHTYTANPLASAVSAASLRLFRRDHLLEKVRKSASYLRKKLLRFKTLKHVAEVRQLGLMAGIELVKDNEAREPYPLSNKMGIQVCQNIRKHGILLRPLGNVIVIMPPLVIQNREIDYLVEGLYQSILEVTEH